MHDPASIYRMPPDQTRIRSFINKAFTPKRISGLEAPIRKRAIAMIEQFRQNPQSRQADIVRQLTYDFPALVVFLLLGVPDEDVPDVKYCLGGSLARREVDDSLISTLLDKLLFTAKNAKSAKEKQR